MKKARYLYRVKHFLVVKASDALKSVGFFHAYNTASSVLYTRTKTVACFNRANIRRKGKTIRLGNGVSNLPLRKGMFDSGKHSNRLFICCLGFKMSNNFAMSNLKNQNQINIAKHQAAIINTYFSDSATTFEIAKYLLRVCVVAQNENEVSPEVIRSLNGLALDILELYELIKKDE